jgi:sugar lactone lactonase YvrE
MADWTVLNHGQRDRLGEGITWSAREGALYWVDILGQRVHRYGLADRAVGHWDLPEMIGWLLERRDEAGFVAGLKSGFYTLTLEPLALEFIGAPEPQLPGNRLNDACTDAEGRIWAGSMAMDGSRPDGSLYRLDPDFTWHPVDRGYRIANGPAISPDGRWLYHADSAAGVVYRLARQAGGGLGPRETFIAFRPEWGAPDGMVVDAEGGIWIAHWGGGCVSRFSPDGRRERWIDLPASQITKPCFAGPDLDRMFLTSAADGVDEELAGAVFEVDPGCTGLPAQPFAG